MFEIGSRVKLKNSGVIGKIYRMGRDSVTRGTVIFVLPDDPIYQKPPFELTELVAGKVITSKLQELPPPHPKYGPYNVALALRPEELELIQ